MSQELAIIHNRQFFHLTPVNMRVVSDFALSSIMYRLGQHNGWTYIGMPTVVCDAQSKLRMRTSIGEVVRIASKVSF